MTHASALHQQAIVVDGVCPLLMDKKFMAWYQEGSVTVVVPTVGGWVPTVEALKTTGAWLRFISQREDLVLARRVADIEAAKRAGKTAVVLHCQGTDQLENDANLVFAWKSMGVGMIQLCYNIKNRVGDGALERTDAGLSHFGVDVVRACNEARVLVDCSHTAYRTTMDAIELSERPVVFSHANCRAVNPHPRNITDEQILAVARTGGLVGTVGFPAFVGGGERPTLDNFIDHIAHIAQVAGIDHTALSIDYYLGMAYANDEAGQHAYYQASIGNGRWRADGYPPPPHFFPQGIETPRTLPALTQRLLERGFSDEDVTKILGGNWLRVWREVWGE